MYAVNNLSIHFTGKALFEDVSFLINNRDRIGLTGKNGAGKSTLLKILAGIREPDKGSLSFPNNTSVGYLPQDIASQSGRTIYDEAATAFQEVHKLEAHIEKLTEELTHRQDYDSDSYMDLANELYEANEKLQVLGSNKMESQVEKILLGLGFERKDFERKMEEFSGGWQMRVELAKILLRMPDLLLLDEPTNHLDIESIQWLEGFLKSYRGAIVLISHDRAFLDNLTNRTIEIESGKIYDYKAHYSKYLELRQMRREQQMAAFNNQQKEIADMERFVDRFKAKASKAKQAQSVMKQLDKIDRIEIDTEDTASMKFRFPEAPRCGQMVARAKNLTKAYGEKVILKNIDLTIERGDRIAFVGKNGEGKTTLSKILAKDETYQGTLDLGQNVSIGYYAQHQAESLDPEKTVLDTIDDAARGDMRTKVRSLLGAFLFSGETVEKKVKVLSGGEKARLSLAKLMLEPFNLLILDEPTNHLDMRSKDVLKNALLQFNGTVVVVSHDRDFLQGLTNKVYEFKGGVIKEYLGDVYYFLEQKQMSNLQELEKTSQAKKDKKAADETLEKTFNNKDERRKYENDQRQIKNTIAKTEKEIETLETSLKEMEEKLKDPNLFKEAEKNAVIFVEYDQLKGKLEKKMAEWESLQEKL